MAKPGRFTYENLAGSETDGAYKVPGPDGFSPYFFQKYWHIVGSRVSTEIERIFLTWQLQKHLNESVICLLPNGEKLESLTQFRPIFLCNVLLKVVIKTLINHLHSILPKLISQYQASFIAGRSTSNNIIVAQELIHSLSNRKSKKGGFILKIDLEKAYDHIDWEFLGEILQITSF